MNRKVSFATLAEPNIQAWKTFASDAVQQGRLDIQPGDPWAAYWAINSARALAQVPPLEWPPPLAPTFSINNITAAQYYPAPSPYYNVWHSLAGYTPGSDWMRLRVSPTLQTRQRHATPSQLVLPLIRTKSNIKHPWASGNGTTFPTTLPPHADGDWINIELTPFNSDLVPGAAVVTALAITV